MGVASPERNAQLWGMENQRSSFIGMPLASPSFWRVQKRMLTSAGLLVLAALLPACATDEGPTVGERVATELVEVWRTGDQIAAEDLLDPAVTWEDRGSGTMALGFPEAVEYLLGIHSWTESLFVDVVSIEATDTSATLEWIMEGVTTVPGDPAARSHFRVEGATLLQIEGGQIVSAVDYSNPINLILARGGAVTLPDGTVLQANRIEDEAGG